MMRNLKYGVGEGRVNGKKSNEEEQEEEERRGRGRREEDPLRRFFRRYSFSPFSSFQEWENHPHVPWVETQNFAFAFL